MQLATVQVYLSLQVVDITPRNHAAVILLHPKQHSCSHIIHHVLTVSQLVHSSRHHPARNQDTTDAVLMKRVKRGT